MSLARRHSFYEADARARIAGLLDADSFVEFLGPTHRAMSPHLAQLDQPAAFPVGELLDRCSVQSLSVSGA